MKRLILAMLALALLCAGPAMAQQAQGEDAAAKRRDIRRLLEVTGSAQLGQQILGQMIATFKKASARADNDRAGWSGRAGRAGGAGEAGGAAFEKPATCPTCPTCPTRPFRCSTVTGSRRQRSTRR